MMRPISSLLLLAAIACLPASAQVVVNVPAGGDVAGAAATVLAAGGGTVNLAAGTYNITQSIVLGSNMTISGAGPTTLLQLPVSPNGIAMFTSNGGSNMTIENMVLDGRVPPGAFLTTGTTSNPYESSGVYMFSYSSAEQAVTLKNLEIRNFGIGLLMGTVNGLTIDTVYVHDNNPGNFAHNAYLVSCDNLNIVHSRFNNAHLGDGLHIDFGGTNTVISKSEFSANNGYGVLSQENVNVTFADTITDFNTNDGIQINASGLEMLRNRGSYNGGYGFDIPSTLDGNGHLNGYYGYGNGTDIGYFYQSSIANITGNLSYPPSPANRYEAEQADGVLGANDTADWTTAYSGFSGVGAVDFNANHLSNGLLSFSHVGVVAAGSYPLVFRYSNGTSGALPMKLTVNGVAQTPLSFPSTGSNSTWSTITVNAPLNAGANVVQISPSGSAAPEIDYLAVTTSTPAAPAAPTNLTATAASPYQVNLTWTPSPGASGYNVFQNGRIVANNITPSSYSDTRILLGHSTLNYTVQAVNQGGASGLSAAATVTTPIDAPAGLQVGGTSADQPGNALNWMSANGASYYNVKRSTTSGGPYTAIAKVTNTTNLVSQNFEQTYTDTGALANTGYYYVVSAVDSSGNESVNSYQVGIVTAPPGFTLAASPAAVSAAVGQNAVTAISVSPTEGFNTATVTLSASGLPAGASGTFTPLSGNVSTFTISVSSATPLGTYNVVVTGASGSLSRSTTVALTVASQLITFNPIPPQVVGTSLAVSATASSGLPVSFSVVPNGVCSISGNVVTFNTTGNCGIVANQAGNATYGPAPAVGQVVVVNSTPSAQTITFAAIGTQTAGTTIALSATATSALPVTFTSSTQSVCKVSGSTASLIAAGTCTITASQAGNGSYNAATPVSQSFTVVAPVSVTIAPLTLTPGKGEAVGVTISGASSAPANLGLGGTACVNIAGCQYNLGGSNGYIGFEFLNVSNTGAMLAVFVSSNAQAGGAYSVPITIGSAVVGTLTLSVPFTAQTISFGSIAPQVVGTPLALSASATSGLPVSYTSSPTSVCTVSGSTASFLAAGTCTITASQAGNNAYTAAPSVSQSFTVNPSVSAPSVSLAPGKGATVSVSIAGASSAPATLGLGGTACENKSGCQYNLGAGNGTIGFEFINVASSGATLVLFVNSTAKTSTTPYSIPITIGSAIVGTLKLTVP